LITDQATNVGMYLEHRDKHELWPKSIPYHEQQQREEDSWNGDDERIPQMRGQLHARNCIGVVEDSELFWHQLLEATQSQSRSQRCSLGAWPAERLHGTRTIRWQRQQLQHRELLGQWFRCRNLRVIEIGSAKGDANASTVVVTSQVDI
jgi:hypothetical protein